MPVEIPKQMRAMGWRHGGGAPEPIEVPTPTPGPGQMLVRVAWSATNPADHKVSSGQFVGRFLHARVLPLVLGYDFAGPIAALGSGVADFQVGDEVYGHLAYAASTRQGAFAEWVAVDRGTVAKRPAAMTADVAAAAATPGLTALQSLRNLGRLPEGGRVLLIGAAGGVGSLAIGVAHRLGAKVTAVCSTYAIDFVRGLGADEVVDRRQQDPLRTPGPFDVVFDAAAAHSFLACKQLLGPRGAYVRTLPDLGIGIGKLVTLFSSQRCEFITVQPVAQDLELLASWVGAGLPVPIDARFPVRELARGLERSQKGEVRGRVVIQVEGGF